MEVLRTILDRLEKPIAFAARGGAQALKVRDLSDYVHGQIAQARAATALEPIRQRLEELGRLFDGYEGAGGGERQQRLRSATTLLEGLRSVSAAPLPAVDPAVWETPAAAVPGIGAHRSQVLARRGIETLEDLLFTLPWRYEDRSRLRPIAELRLGEDLTCSGTVQSARLIMTRGRLAIFELLIGDDTGSVVARWFNQPYLKKVFQTGQRVMLSGRLKLNRYHGRAVELESPVYELLDSDDPLHTGRVVPIYPETRGFSARQYRTLMWQILDRYPPQLPERIPAEIRVRHGLLPTGEALRRAHFPDAGSAVEVLNRFRSEAQRTLILDELLLLQLGLGLRRSAARQARNAPALRAGGARSRALIKALPYRLTAAQQRVLAEIGRDLGQQRPMNRLLQGDVGSGKTVVAAACIARAVDSGYQAALMVPTEILAEQHAATLRRFLEPLGMRVETVEGGARRAERERCAAAVETGAVDVAVGTHALLEAGVRFARLGLAVVDEQHKFGVLQRARLTAKGYHPHVLVMTATPIPRTLALTVYGDLDVSVIDALPQGRTPIRTQRLGEAQRARAYRLIRDEVARGRQAYVVFPLVEQSAKSDLKAACAGAEQLQREIFPDLAIGLLHGQMKAGAKDAVMAEFAAGRIQILAATTVIEVGIDVPNASVMLIEHAERFGLAQLHQLRGRVGRGEYASHCVLMAPAAVTEDAARRLEAMVRTQDGFAIAEEDLAIRGPGEFFGVRQSGLPELRVAQIVRDAAFLEPMRAEVGRILRLDPTLQRPEVAPLRAALRRKWGPRLELGGVS